jgi:GntR family transcriptional regulator
MMRLSGRIVLPEALFDGIAERDDVPNTLYDVFQSEYGVLIVRAADLVSATACNARMAVVLSIEQGTPLTVLDRVAYTINDVAAEWRVSHCHLAGRAYAAAVE